eukprot:3769118-Ditylum_brightwellii.AAC.1
MITNHHKENEQDVESALLFLSQSSCHVDVDETSSLDVINDDSHIKMKWCKLCHANNGHIIFDMHFAVVAVVEMILKDFHWQ